MSDCGSGADVAGCDLAGEGPGEDEGAGVGSDAAALHCDGLGQQLAATVVPQLPFRHVPRPVHHQRVRPVRHGEGLAAQPDREPAAGRAAQGDGGGVRYRVQLQLHLNLHSPLLHSCTLHCSVARYTLHCRQHTDYKYTVFPHLTGGQGEAAPQEVPAPALRPRRQAVVVCSGGGVGVVH